MASTWGLIVLISLASVVGGFKLYVQLFRQRVGWTRTIGEKLDGATRGRISDILSRDEARDSLE